MFIGSYSSKLSIKGRSALPFKFREELGQRVVIAKWYEGCLVIVSTENWVELLQKITGKAEMITQGVRDTDRFILASAFEVDLDDQGRFVIPKSLRDYGNLGSEVIYLGLGDRVELWDKRSWIEREAYIQKTAVETLENLANAKFKKSEESS